MAFPGLNERVSEVRARIDAAVQRGGRGQNVRIVAVTKTHGPEAVIAAHDAGLGDVGENRVQEAIGKMSEVDVPVRWHLIGHLQRNKVKSLTRFELFHALDSVKLADSVNAFAIESGATINALVQVNVVGEETKGGLSLGEVEQNATWLASLDGVRIKGVMTMARFEADEKELRRTFSGARDALETLARHGAAQATELSMGMSGDYEIAVEEGATMVRLGTTLFGARDQ